MRNTFHNTLPMLLCLRGDAFDFYLRCCFKSLSTVSSFLNLCNNLSMIHFFQPLLRNFVLICRAFNPLSSYKSLFRCLYSLLNTITYKHRVTSSSRRHFSRCYLKANKAIKSETIRTLYYHNSFESVLMLLAKIIKISSCLAKLQITKFGAFLRHSVQQCDCISVKSSCVVKYF